MQVDGPRKIVKAARKRQEDKLIDEDGNELEFEGEEFEDPNVVEDVVQREDDDSDDWEDDGDSDEEMETSKKP